MTNSTAKTPERYTFVVYRSQPNALNQQLKSLMFATEDPTIAYGERDRLNSELTPKERYTDAVTYVVEKIPVLARRKSRHPFMRGQGQRDMFDPQTVEKNGNIDPDYHQKSRGRISQNRAHAINHH